MAKYKCGDLIPMAAGGNAKIIAELGEGGQGTVYKVEYQEHEYALKWYKKGGIRKKDQFYDNIKNNIDNPAQSKAFLWPLYLTEKYDDSFGYLMELRPKEYHDFSDFLLAKVHFKTIDACLNAALNIVDGFLDLHARGYSYQDLNDGNFFINPNNGDVLICDNDNVSENGESQGIAGKMRYMAPEIVRGECKPDLLTDRFSMAIVLFMIMFNDHPLDGKMTMVPCMTASKEKEVYGTDPVFIFDDQDRRNCPVAGVNVNALMIWPYYPEYIKNTFKKAFSHAAMCNPDRPDRITERQWKKLLLQAKSDVFVCKCGEEHFYNHNSGCCPGCKKKYENTIKLCGYYDVLCYPGKYVYEFQLNGDKEDYKKPIGQVFSHPKEKSILVLKNISDEKWIATIPDGRKVDVNPGTSVPIKAGLQLRILGNDINVK